MSSERETVDISSLNEDEQKLFLSTKIKMFKVTIMTCALYGIIGFVILLLSLYTEWGRQNLYEKMQYFIITYIIGTIIIIIYLAYSVFTFEPTKPVQDMGYDTEMCPDYWVLEKSNISDEHSYFNTKTNSELNLNHFKYKCKMDPSIFSSQKIKNAHSGNFDTHATIGSELVKTINDDEDTEIKEIDKMKQYASIMSGYTLNSTDLSANNDSSVKYKDGSSNFSYDKNNIPLTCDQVYPMYLSTMDAEYAKKNPGEPNNVFRCAYSKLCKVPWTEAGCSN